MVPHDADLVNSPGTHLKYRLPSSNSQGWRLFGATAVCLVWNGIVAVFAILGRALRIYAAKGIGGWICLCAPFLLVGVFLIYYFVRELLIVTGAGQTFVEISDHPLVPGGSYELYLRRGDICR